MARRIKDSRKSAPVSNGEEENFSEFFESDNRSEGESTALSSLLPIVSSSQVRASAPRASMPDLTNDVGLTSHSAVPDVINTPSNAHHKKSDEAPVKDLDDYTVETNRPIDSVYIYPTNPTPSTSHRQRRNYRSGRHSDGVSRASTQVESEYSKSNFGILETLGLGSVTDYETDASTRFSKYGKYSFGSRSTWDRRRRKTDSRPQVHLRAAMIFFFLMSILYGAAKYIIMAKEHSKLLSKRGRRNSAKNKHYDPFEEGKDRPVGDWMKDEISKISSTNKAAQTLAKVTKKEEGPDNLLDSNLRASIKNNEENREAELKEKKAPADSLDVIDKREEEEETKLSLAVQSGLADVYSKDPLHDDIPFLWYIPRSGGGMVKNILSNCKDLIVASEVGGTVKGNKDTLEVVDVAGHKYVNVDTTTANGIKDAKAKELVSSGLANLIVSPRIQEAAGLFGPSKKGRVFAFFRHPVERAVSMFFFLKKHNVTAIKTLELEDYSKSPHVENNWMVRILSDSMTGEIGDTHLEMAKRLLKEKVIIGLMEQKEESMRRFEYHYGWKYTENNQKQSACRSRILGGDYRSNESAKGKIKEGSQAWTLLMWQNRLDMKLYTYAKALYLQQGSELFSDMY